MALDIGAKSSKNGLGGAIAGGALGIVGGLINSNQQDKREQRAYENQRKLNEQGQELGVKTWKETNAPAQVEQLEKAGLSTGLMYGKGGSGGTVASPSGGSAPSPQQMDISGHAQNAIQTALAKSTIKLQDSQANKNIVETEKTAGIDTTEGQTRVNKMLAEIPNERLKGLLLEAQEANTIEDTAKKFQEVQIANLDRQIKNNTFDDIIKSIKEEAIGKEIRNQLNSMNIEKTESQINEIKNSILQKWVGLGVNAIGNIGGLITKALKKPSNFNKTFNKNDNSINNYN